MKRIKTSISLFITLCLLLCLSPAALAVVGQSESFYAADYANVLSSDTEEMICGYNGALEQQCDGAQIVVVTVEYLDGMYSDEYAYQLFNDWGVGSAEHNNGMLLLLATAENKAWLAYGMGLNSNIDSDDVDEMLDDYFWSDFDRGSYDAAVQKLFPQLLDWYDDLYGSNVLNSAPTSAGMGHGGGGYNESGISSDSVESLVSTIITIVVIAIVFSAIFGGSGRRRRYGYRNNSSSWLPWFLLFNSQRNNSRHHRSWDDDDHFPPFGGGFGGGRGGGFGGGGFGGGSGFGGGGFSGGGGGRR